MNTVMGALRAVKDMVIPKSDEKAPRPKTFAEYGGQEQVVDGLRVSVGAARGRGKALDHTLITGGAGLGKTTLAQILANELGVKMVQMMGPMVKTKEELVQTLVRMTKNGLLFIDEIHALHPKVAEVLYTAMEDYEVTVEGHRVRIQPFTLVGATTNSGQLLKPLKDRFGIKAALRPYSVEKIAEIVRSAAAKSGLSLSEDGAAEVARRSQQTPRIALAILRRVEDCAFAAGTKAVDVAVATRGCDMAGYDKSGLNALSRLYLKILADRAAPTALGTMVSMLGETKDVIEDEVEPYLLSIGFIEKTPKGRVATPAGRRHTMAVA